MKERHKLLVEYRHTVDPETRRELAHRLLNHNLRIAGSVAREYKGYGEWGDLLGLATEGLARALDAWDPKRSPDFNGFAKLVIRRHLSREARSLVTQFRSPKAVHDDMKAVGHASEQFLVANGRPPTQEEIRALCPGRSPVAYDPDGQWPVAVAMDEEVEATVADAGGDVEEDVLSVVAAESSRKATEKLFSALTDEERLVLVKSLGLDDGEPLSLKEVGRLLHPHRPRQYVARVKNEALEKLRKHPAAKDLLAAMEE